MRDFKVEIKDFLAYGSTTLSNSLWLYYHKMGVTDSEFLLYLQLNYFQQQGNFFPQPEELAFHLGKKVQEVYELLDALQKKKWISLETLTDEHQMKYDQYDLTPFYDQLELFLQKEGKKQQQIKELSQVKELYRTFEQEFSRSLSPFELEMVAQWLNDDHYSPELIKLALKEAVLNQAYSLKYMDRILLNWEKKNITTPKQVEKEQQRREEDIPKTSTEIPDIPFAPWLEKGGK